MAAMMSFLLLVLPLQAVAWTAAPYTAPPANCGAQALTSPIPPSCFGAGGVLPTGWTCPVQPGSANGAHTCGNYSMRGTHRTQGCALRVVGTHEMGGLKN
jgi:hypothetical protein